MNSTPSHPVAIILFTFGVFFLVVPPVGVALMISGVLVHCQSRRVARHYQQKANRARAEARQRERWLAAKAL